MTLAAPSGDEADEGHEEQGPVDPATFKYLPPEHDVQASVEEAVLYFPVEQAEHPCNATDTKERAVLKALFEEVVRIERDTANASYKV